MSHSRISPLADKRINFGLSDGYLSFVFQRSEERHIPICWFDGEQNVDRRDIFLKWKSRHALDAVLTVDPKVALWMDSPDCTILDMDWTPRSSLSKGLDHQRCLVTQQAVRQLVIGITHSAPGIPEHAIRTLIPPRLVG